MAEAKWKIGLQRFLASNCPEPEVLGAALERVGLAPRINLVLDLDYLCRQGDVADCLWIVCEGYVRVERQGGEIVLRGAGEVVGEQAFYRETGAETHRPTRGACLRASGAVTLLRIDRSVIAAMDVKEQAVWHETIARALCRKLDQATDQRHVLAGHRRDLDQLIRRFVCPEGREAALAAIDDTREIGYHRSDAVLWFSDIKGFSAYASTLAPDEVGDLIRLVMEVQSEEIVKASGQIDKYMGDGLMAFWICPDTSRLAVACEAATTAALTAAARLQAMFSSRGFPIDIRIGLHAGSAVFGDFGGANRIAFTCTGQTVNDASRYEQASVCEHALPLGAVRVSAPLYARIGSEAIRARFGPQRRFKDKHGVYFETYESGI